MLSFLEEVITLLIALPGAAASVLFAVAAIRYLTVRSRNKRDPGSVPPAVLYAQQRFFMITGIVLGAICTVLTTFLVTSLYIGPLASLVATVIPGTVITLFVVALERFLRVQQQHKCAPDSVPTEVWESRRRFLNTMITVACVHAGIVTGMIYLGFQIITNM